VRTTDGHAGGDAHRALAADEAPAQVVAGDIGFQAAQLRDRTVAHHALHREHMGGGDPRREAVRPAGVGADVAADGAGLLRRRIGRVVQAEVGDLTAEVEVEHAGLDPRDALVGVDTEHPVHLGSDDHERVVERGGAAGEAGATPPYHERPVVPRGDAHRLRDVVAVAGEADCGRLAACDARVARVQRELERFGAGTVGTERGPQVGEERVRRVGTGVDASVDGPETTTNRRRNTV